jgi:hypothetical protein
MNQIRQVQAQLRSGKEAWLREDEARRASRRTGKPAKADRERDSDLQIFYLSLYSQLSNALDIKGLSILGSGNFLRIANFYLMDAKDVSLSNGEVWKN